ncbi:ABC transporter ATP-binding protein [Mycoplasma bradburyae]|uniref:ABC transporter ATP-binding protein n=1 Tax=Mycoplasma bradburyae TaxID=2963128 RepID=A0AAW6HN25_9MOLU|nr:ABC transporter ATP-binding protein [Mycoplasma bradburyae]MDC4183232.1 ABC transporter ATP-binding protein [Mycoplasma bradburyae]UTS70879.1 ABC transporter ATP-binding protein [Mycoplasma bradburyae]
MSNLQITKHIKEATIANDLEYLKIDWEQPVVYVVYNFGEFNNIYNSYIGNVIYYIRQRTEKICSLRPNFKVNVNSFCNNLQYLKQNLDQTYGKMFYFYNFQTKQEQYLIKKFVDHVNEITNQLIFMINDYIYELKQKNRTVERKKQANSQEEYESILNEESSIMINYFKKLENNVSDDAYLGDNWIKKTEVSIKQREQKIKDFFKILNLKKYETVNLPNIYKKIDKFKQNLETAFWNLEVSKVSILNKPHKVKEVIPTKSDYVIDLKNVTKYYSNGVTTTKVLKNVNLQIPWGEFVVILGPSGSGKTTLLNIISGMDRASSGTTFVANKNLIGFSDTQLTKFRQENIGYIFQQYGLLPNLNVKENIEIGSFLQRDASKRADIDQLLKSIGMYEQRNKLPTELSGGQQQRVSIARAIAKNPTIIFGDEPTGALDEEMTQVVLEEFVNINKKNKTTLIIVTHNPLIADIATMVIRVGDGTIKSVVRNENPKTVREINWS